jgi:hypothetical protein
MDQQIASRLGADLFLPHILFAYLSDSVNVASVYKMYPIGWFSI